MNASARPSGIIAAAIVLGCLLLGLLLSRPSPAQNAPAPALRPYQIVSMAHENSRDVVVVMETATGHCWGTVAAQDNKWFDMGTPGKVKK